MHWINLNEKIEIIEVGPRDGFQSLPFFIPTSLKIKIINNLINAGLKNIQITSFVNPNIVPQFRDAEDIVSCFKEQNNIILHSLILNYKGFLRALEAGASGIEVSISASDEFSRKNTNMSFEQALNEAKEIIKKAKEANIYIRGSIQCAFGYKNPEDVPLGNIMKICDMFLNEEIDEIAFADTTAICNPRILNVFFDKVVKYLNIVLISMHFHSKMNMGLVNIYEAFKLGIRRFDTSFGFIGGCPFVEDSKINVSTEEAVNLFNSLGIDTGINIDILKKCSDFLEQLSKQ